MKLKTTSLAALAAFALAGPASAAGVWSAIDWTDDSSLSFITNSNVTHSGDFNSTATVNGFTFETISIETSSVGPGFGVFSSPYTGSNFSVTSSAATANTFTYNGSAGVSGAASSLLNAGLIGFGTPVAAGGVITYSLIGLAANTNYEFYFFNPEWSEGAHTGSLIGNDVGATSFAISQAPGAGDKIIKYAYNTGLATSFTMTATSDVQGASLHNYAFVNVIPEPSTALLSGLGMLALLRRRR